MPTPTFSQLTLESLVREFYPYVHRLALTILDTGNPLSAGEAEDAAQEIFLQAARALPEFRGEASPKTWLTSIAVNHCRGRLRKRHSQLRVLNRFSVRRADNRVEDGPESSLSAIDEKRALWAAVDQLPEKQRVPILLYYVHDLTTAEIAIALKLPEGTVHSRLYHARRRLQALLEKSNG